MKLPKPKIPKGMERAYYRCKHKGCKRVYYRDYIPYGLGRGVMWTDCGHSIGYGDYNLETISQSEFLAALSPKVEEQP